MGNDGGSIPTRRELVKEAARNPTSAEAKEKALEQLTYQWSTCLLSQKKLQEPVVSDGLGRMFNKDAVFKYLLPENLRPADNPSEIARSEQERVVGTTISSLKDVVELKFETEDDRWICPITQKVLGPNIKATYIVPCGHVFADSAVREIESSTCLKCNDPFEPENAIPISSQVPEDIERLSARLVDLKKRGLSHSLKSVSKKRKKDTKEKEAPKKKVALVKGTNNDFMTRGYTIK
jgi:hypothetical protein